MNISCDYIVQLVEYISEVLSIVTQDTQQTHVNQFHNSNIRKYSNIHSK